MKTLQSKLLIVLTCLLAGRAMTLGFIHRAGGDGLGDPPPAWLMPLVGDALIGLTALVMVFLLVKKTGLMAWTLLVVWNAVAIWDALSAWLIHLSVPWPSFFMVQLMGPTMFFAAAAMHGLCLYLICNRVGRRRLLGKLAEQLDLAPKELKFE